MFSKFIQAVAIPAAMFSSIVLAFMIGYNWPRDLELESTKPIQLNYEITKDAAVYLLLRDKGQCIPADDNEQGVRG